MMITEEEIGGRRLEILTPKNMELLRFLEERKPPSFRQLIRSFRGGPYYLARRRKTLEEAGLIEIALERGGYDPEGGKYGRKRKPLTRDRMLISLTPKGRELIGKWRELEACLEGKEKEEDPRRPSGTD